MINDERVQPVVRYYSIHNHPNCAKDAAPKLHTDTGDTAAIKIVAAEIDAAEFDMSYNICEEK